MNIYTKLTLLCIILVLVSSSALIFFSGRQFEKQFRAELLTTIKQESKITIDNIERFLLSRINDIQLTAQNATLQNPDASAEQITSTLRQLESLNTVYYNFSYFDLDRTRIADSKGLAIGEVHSNNLYWRKIGTDNPVVVDVSRSESIGKVVVHFASVVKSLDQGEIIGVVVGRVLIDELYNFLQSIAQSDDPNRQLDVNLVREDGTILYSNQKKNNTLTETYENFYKFTSLSSDSVNFIEDEDIFYFVSRDDHFRDYTGDSWMLIASIPVDQAFASLSTIQRQLIIVSLVVLIISIGLALVAANIFVRPIIKLSKAAAEIGKGNLQTPVDIKSNDEIGKLAKQLQKTAMNLRSQIDEEKELSDQLNDQKGALVKQKSELEEAHKQITSSIDYAKRIQRSMLPSPSDLRRIVKDSFILYRPKDVVSGDFYWFEKVHRGRHEFLILVCADCTGHGVPGAIMSMMGGNQLTNIIYYQNYIEPVKILARLDKAIKLELYRDEETSLKQDGMEIMICVIDLDSLEMKFAGAGMPLIHLNKDGLTVHKSPKLMIGGVEGEDEKAVEAQFELKTMKLEEGDKIYLSSDGFQDQFGGPEDKRLMGRNFRSLLEETQTPKMREQGERLEEKFDSWRGFQQQTDDIVVIGVEFD